ncbi:MAG: histidinol dehydrogenase [Deinococcales bacterium]
MRRLSKDEALKIFQRRAEEAAPLEIRTRVDEIIKEVRLRGDEALRAFSIRFDRVNLVDFRVPASFFAEAHHHLSKDLKEAIQLAITRVKAFYEHQPKEGFIHQSGDALLGQLVRPIERLGCYIPGGSVPLFSSLIMTAVPARVAGVPEIIVSTPARPDGTIAHEIVYTAELLGIDKIYRLGKFKPSQRWLRHSQRAQS